MPFTALALIIACGSMILAFDAFRYGMPGLAFIAALPAVAVITLIVLAIRK